MLTPRSLRVPLRRPLRPCGADVVLVPMYRATDGTANFVRTTWHGSRFWTMVVTISTLSFNRTKLLSSSTLHFCNSETLPFREIGKLETTCSSKLETTCSSVILSISIGFLAVEKYVLVTLNYQATKGHKNLRYSQD